jgi:dolichyl-phosphate-mannose--protein O-mannosyl transferase
MKKTLFFLFYMVAVVVVLVGLCARFYHLGTISSPIFDEVYFPVFAADLLKHVLAFDVHPPFGKMLISLGIWVFGNNPFGWRIVSAIFGTVLLALFPFIWSLWDKTTDKKPFPLPKMIGLWMFAAFIAVETILVSYARVGLMDGILLFLILSCLIPALAWKGWRGTLLAATLIGLTIGTKWYGVAIIVPVGYLFWLKGDLKKYLVSLIWSFAIYLAICLSGQIIGQVANPWQAMMVWHKEVWIYQTTLTATHPWSSLWWQWPILQRPVLMYYRQTSAGIAIMTAIGNPLLWWSSVLVVIFSFFYLLVRLIRRKDVAHHPIMPFLVGYFSFLIPWIPIHRVLFLYHYLPAYGFSLFILMYWLGRLWDYEPWLVFLLFVIFVGCGLYFLPWATAWPLTSSVTAAHVWQKSWLD